MSNEVRAKRRHAQSGITLTKRVEPRPADGYRFPGANRGGSRSRRLGRAHSGISPMVSAPADGLKCGRKHASCVARFWAPQRCSLLSAAAPLEFGGARHAGTSAIFVSAPGDRRDRRRRGGGGRFRRRGPRKWRSRRQPGEIAMPAHHVPAASRHLAGPGLRRHIAQTGRQTAKQGGFLIPVQALRFVDCPRSLANPIAKRNELGTSP